MTEIKVYMPDGVIEDIKKCGLDNGDSIKVLLNNGYGDMALDTLLSGIKKYIKENNKIGENIMANEKEGYQGWKNYETWAVALWMDNDQGSQGYKKELAEQTRVEDKDEWRRDYADALKQWMEDDMPDMGATVWTDLLNGAFSEVNWYEIAQNEIDDIGYGEEAEKGKINPAIEE